MFYHDRITYALKKGDTLDKIANCYKTTVAIILDENPHINSKNLCRGNLITIRPNSAKTMKPQQPVHNDCISNNQLRLNNQMRMLWEQHVMWTRMLIISIAENLKDLDPVRTRLLKNPADFGELYSKYYGVSTGKKVADLLSEHLTIGYKLILALKNGDMNEAGEYNKQWYANADEIAYTLSSINSFYNKEELRDMLYKHLELTTNEVAKRLTGDYAGDISAFDEVEKEALEMADYLTKGIVMQFPEKFV